MSWNALSSIATTKIITNMSQIKHYCKGSKNEAMMDWMYQNIDVLFRLLGTVMKKILIVKMSSLGDILHVLPVIYSLLQRYPGLCVDWVVDQRCKDLLERCFINSASNRGFTRENLSNTFRVLNTTSWWGVALSIQINQ